MSALISPAALEQRLSQPGTRIIDATYPCNPTFFARARIDDAVQFDIDAIADHTTSLPHMLPSAPDFAAAAGALGIGDDDTVVVYDQSGMAMAAARVWWMFRCFGHGSVLVLDGGLPAWQAAGYPLTSGILPAPPVPKLYSARFRPELVRNARQVREALDTPSSVIIDARPAARFLGLTGEPRPGMKTGHIPGSINIPFPELIHPATGTFNTCHPQVLATITASPANIITSCGSGVTACLLALALHEAGRADAAVYDGSWAEWGRESAEMPVAQ